MKPLTFAVLGLFLSIGAAQAQSSDPSGTYLSESGETRVSAGAAPLRLGTGDFCTRRNGKKASVALLPSKDFIAALPRLFVDPLPPRMALYEERAVEAKRREEEVSYADLEAWLKAPPAIRRPLVARFEPLASGAAFRASLIENLKYHPEWSPVLYPAPKEAEAESGVRKGFALRDPVESKTVPTQ